MKSSVVQKKIRLIGFKTINFSLSCVPNTKKDGPTFQLELGNQVFPDNSKVFAKVFQIQIQANHTSESIKISTEYHAIFECSTVVDDAFLESEFAEIAAAAIGFPFVRAFISSVSVQAGYPPIILPSMNFVQYNKRGKKPPLVTEP